MALTLLKKIQPIQADAEREEYVLRDELVIDAESFDALSAAIQSPPPPSPALVALFKRR